MLALQFGMQGSCRLCDVHFRPRRRPVRLFSRAGKPKRPTVVHSRRKASPVHSATLDALSACAGVRAAVSFAPQGKPPQICKRIAAPRCRAQTTMLTADIGGAIQLFVNRLSARASAESQALHLVIAHGFRAQVFLAPARMHARMCTMLQLHESHLQAFTAPALTPALPLSTPCVNPKDARHCSKRSFIARTVPRVMRSLARMTFSRSRCSASLLGGKLTNTHDEMQPPLCAAHFAPPCFVQAVLWRSCARRIAMSIRCL